MRTSEEQVALYNDLTLKEAAKRLSLSVEQVKALGDAGHLEMRDYRIEGAKKGVYRITATSVAALREQRVVRKASA